MVIDEHGSAGSRFWTWIGTPGKRRLPPQWSKCRCVLMTQAMSRGMFSGCGVGLRSSISGLESTIPVSTSTSPAGWSIVQYEHGQALAVDEELCREVGADHVPTLTPGAGSGALGGASDPGSGDSGSGSETWLGRRCRLRVWACWSGLDCGSHARPPRSAFANAGPAKSDQPRRKRGTTEGMGLGAAIKNDWLRGSLRDLGASR